VAGLVAEAVVDGLEAVDVDDHHRPLTPVPGAERDVAVQFGAEAATVEEARERIVIGEVPEFRLGLRSALESAGDDLPVLVVQLVQYCIDGGLTRRRETVPGHSWTVVPVGSQMRIGICIGRISSQFR